ncbi:MAG: AbrB/MazE/SpoVT family DNA-binding domain-containing protein [Verrucomicrobia bacterium]|nr:AbrB/MazE/SpoVT family DNA-binding domain-containing protein [Verrucomicrobiota bacterium]
MTPTTVTLSSKGQLSLPKEIRDTDSLEASDVFRLERLARGKYLLEKMSAPARTRARLVRSKDGFMVFQPPKGAPRITLDLVKKLEAETL